MKTVRDKNYLRLQFEYKVYRKSATDFQRFFEELMKKAHKSNFRVIKPYGKEGDGGNDGYRPKEGIYYQVYAPHDPNDKEAQAAVKLKDDFQKILDHWDEIKNVKEYYFVYNDKGEGSTAALERSLSDLSKDHPDIAFNLMTPDDLEEIFFTLEDDEILSLGFDIDLTHAVSMVREILNKLELELDRDNSIFVLTSLSGMTDLIDELANEDLTLKYGILHARSLDRLDRIDEAISEYEKLIVLYPEDPEPYLYLAELHLRQGDLVKNNELMDAAEKLDPDHWLLRIEKLVRATHTDGTVDHLSHVDPKEFPDDPRQKSNFYRIYAGLFENSGDYVTANQYIEMALKLNPDRFSNYEAKLGLMSGRLVFPEKEVTPEQQIRLADEILSFVSEIKQSDRFWANLGSRNKALVYFREFTAHRIKENYVEASTAAKNCLDAALDCHVDKLIDELIFKILNFIDLAPHYFDKLLSKLATTKYMISRDLTNKLITQFLLKETLFTEGRKFFNLRGDKAVLNFIKSLESRDIESVIGYIADDVAFAVDVAAASRDYKELRNKIISRIPDDGSVDKNKLLLLLSSTEGDSDKAFELLKDMDLARLTYFESKAVLKVAETKNAWDFVIILVNNLLRREKDPQRIVYLKLRLFNAYIKTYQLPKAYGLGVAILSSSEELSLLTEDSKEVLLGQTVLAYINHGDYPAAEKLVETYADLFVSYEYVLDVKVDAHIKNGNGEKAIAALIQGFQLLANPRDEDYGFAYFKTVLIDNLVKVKLDSLPSIQDGTFFKVKGRDKWYFLGNGMPLDATKVSMDDPKYGLFIDKKVNDSVDLINKYSSEVNILEIEQILEVGPYIVWQSQYYAHKLTVEGRWDAMKLIEVPSTADGNIDTRFIQSMLADQQAATGDIFDRYVEHNLPISFLAANQGSLAKAISTLVSEERGFVKFSSGSRDDMMTQVNIAKKIIEGADFYIDGTAALVLAETGLLTEVYPYLQGMKIPQSVITLLLKTNDLLRLSPGQAGYLGLVKGNIRMTPVDTDRRAKVVRNIEDSIALLESMPERIEVISEVNKVDVAAERRIDAALCDSCILAQKSGDYVLTDDFLYLQANKLQTKKESPEFTSSYTMVRTLYEYGKLSLDKYLAFYSYLAGYRYRFLPITVDDLYKAVFGDKDYQIFTPENIQLFNLRLTMSKEYGVDIEAAFSVLGQFLVRMLVDESVTREMMDRVFVEVLENLPSNIDRRLFGETFIKLSVNAINKVKRSVFVKTKIQEKVDSLSGITNLYESGHIITSQNPSLFDSG